MKEKKLLIVEHAGSTMSSSRETIANDKGNLEESIVLTGIFTTFNQKNRNGRVYESADFMPHVEALKEQIENRSLLGELDHPHGFEITLANVSHVIESLEFDPQQNAIIGKIRLLNTAKGKDAQALVRDGIPLKISSRAAGTVDESGHVKLQQLFTYDLVADPGFANAVLTRVNEGVETNPISEESRNALKALNESYNHMNEGLKMVASNENTQVYEIVEDANTELTPAPSQEGERAVDFGEPQMSANANAASKGTIDDKIQTNDNNMDNEQFISMSDFQKYSEHLAEIIGDLQSAIANYKTELAAVKAEQNPAAPSEKFDADKIDNNAISDLVAKGVAEKSAEMEEQYNNLKAYCEYLAEQLDNTISHNDHIAEEANKMIADQTAMNEKMSQIIEHQDYIVDNLNDTIGYQNYVAEMLDKSIDYSNMIAEEANKSIAYQNYLSEKMNQMVDHQDYIAEEANKMIAHQDYLAENMNKMIAHQDYLAENLENSINYSNYIAESVNAGATAPAVNEGVETKAELVEESAVSEPIVEVPAFDSKKYQTELSEKLDTLLSTVKTKYEEAKKAEAEAIAESKARTESADFNLINYMPARLVERWSKLTDERKKEILAESKMFIINNPASAEYFWNTRDMRDKQIAVEKLEEEKTAAPAPQVNENVMNNDYYKMLAEQTKYRMRKW